MKNLLFIFLVAFAASTFSQSTSPRFGTTAGADNTGRAITYKKTVATDATGADTVKIAPTAFYNYVSTTVNDSIVYNIPVTKSYYGDELIFTITNTSGASHKVEFLTTNVELATAGKITLTSAKRALFVFIFDGVKYVERSRVVQ